jgi:hypothetical protein
LGLFDIFKGKKEGSANKSNPADKWAGSATDRRAQPYDRQEALSELAKLGTKEAVAVLLKRFTFVVDPSITDQEEREIAYQGILAVGPDAVEPVRAFAARAESLSWPMRILKELVSEEALVLELVSWLEKWDTEYAKFVDPKVQLLAALEDYKHESIARAVLPFLEDVNETARYHAVATLVAQGDPSVALPFLDAYAGEESVRVRTKIIEGFQALDLRVPDERLDVVRKGLPDRFNVNGEGAFSRR